MYLSQLPSAQSRHQHLLSLSHLSLPQHTPSPPPTTTPSSTQKNSSLTSDSIDKITPLISLSHHPQKHPNKNSSHCSTPNQSLPLQTHDHIAPKSQNQTTPPPPKPKPRSKQPTTRQPSHQSPLIPVRCNMLTAMEGNFRQIPFNSFFNFFFFFFRFLRNLTDSRNDGSAAVVDREAQVRRRRGRRGSSSSRKRSISVTIVM